MVLFTSVPIGVAMQIATCRLVNDSTFLNIVTLRVRTWWPPTSRCIYYLHSKSKASTIYSKCLFLVTEDENSHGCRHYIPLTIYKRHIKGLVHSCLPRSVSISSMQLSCELAEIGMCLNSELVSESKVEAKLCTPYLNSSTFHWKGSLYIQPFKH